MSAEHGSRSVAFAFLRCTLGLVLLVAAGLKGYQLATELIVGDDILHSRWLLVGLVEGELFFGIWLWSGAFQKPTWTLSIIWFSLLGSISLWNALAGAGNCGCFGKVAVNPWWTFVLDCCAVASLLRWRPEPVSSEIRVCHVYARTGAVLALTLFIGIPAGFAMNAFAPAALADAGSIPAAGEIVLLKPAGWKGRRLPILRHLDFSEQLSSGRWVLVFFHHDCPKCQAVIPEYEALAARLQSERAELRVAFIEMPPFNATLKAASPACLMVKLRSTNDWFMSTPCELEMRDGVVEAVKETLEPGQGARRAPSQGTSTHQLPGQRPYRQRLLIRVGMGSASCSPVDRKPSFAQS